MIFTFFYKHFYKHLILEKKCISTDVGKIPLFGLLTFEVCDPSKIIKYRMQMLGKP